MFNRYYAVHESSQLLTTKHTETFLISHCHNLQLDIVIPKQQALTARMLSLVSKVKSQSSRYQVVMTMTTGAA